MMTSGATANEFSTLATEWKVSQKGGIVGNGGCGWGCEAHSTIRKLISTASKSLIIMPKTIFAQLCWNPEQSHRFPLPLLPYVPHDHDRNTYTYLYIFTAIPYFSYKPIQFQSEFTRKCRHKQHECSKSLARSTEWRYRCRVSNWQRSKRGQH